MENWIKDLEYYLMPAKKPVAGFEKQYEEIYSCWREGWEKFRSEIGVQKNLSSDSFLIADEVGAIFYKGECVALSAFTYGDLKKPYFRQMAWWEGWGQDSYDSLASISTNALICSLFTVNPKFAGKNQVTRWKDIISLISMLRFECSMGDVMAGNLNLTKGMDNACGKTSGGTLIGTPFLYDYHGVELRSQLVCYERDYIQQMKDEKNISQLCEDLWSRLIHLSDFPVYQNNIIPLKKTA